MSGGSYYGRVEIYYDGVWGTVCDDSWSFADAEVVCRQLGLGPAIRTYYNAYYGEGEGPIILDDVFCSGYESRLDECDNAGLYNHDCYYWEVAGIECSAGTKMRILQNLDVGLCCRLLDFKIVHE